MSKRFPNYQLYPTFYYRKSPPELKIDAFLQAMTDTTIEQFKLSYTHLMLKPIEIYRSEYNLKL